MAVLFGGTALLVLTYMSLWFCIAVWKRDNGIADIAWGLGFVVIAWAIYSMVSMPDFRSLLVTLLVTLWGLRLVWHIGSRNLASEKEDFRYAKMRKNWGEQWIRKSFFRVFMFQGLIMFIISLPIILMPMYVGYPFGLMDIVGIAVFSIGFLFESVSDYQLRVFKQNPANKGRILMAGLWRYSRHPNYFGESLVWWGIFCFSAHTIWAIIAVLGPITITFFLLRVSGIPFLERRYKDHPEYQAYAERTSIFIPLPPKV